MEIRNKPILLWNQQMLDFEDEFVASQKHFQRGKKVLVHSHLVFQEQIGSYVASTKVSVIILQHCLSLLIPLSKIMISYFSLKSRLYFHSLYSLRLNCLIQTFIYFLYTFFKMDFNIFNLGSQHYLIFKMEFNIFY